MRLGLRGKVRPVNVYTEDILEDIRVQLIAFGEETYDLFCEGPFKYILELKWSKRTINALWALITQEVEVEGAVDELWFRVGNTNIRFGAREFALVIGLQFGDSGFDPNKQYTIPERSCLHYYRELPTVDQLHLDFKDLRIELSSLADDYVRIAEILFVYRWLAGFDGRGCVHTWVVALADSNVQWASFPWGSWSYSVLLHQMSVVVRILEVIGDGGLLHVYGPFLDIRGMVLRGYPGFA